MADDPLIDLPGVEGSSPEVPVPSKGGRDRLLAEVAGAQAETVDRIEEVLQTSVEEAKDLGGFRAVGGDERLLPVFIAYGSRLYLAYSAEIGRQTEDPETCEQILRKTLPWAIALKIAPEQKYNSYEHDLRTGRGTEPAVEGDWYKLFYRAKERISPNPFPKKMYLSFLVPVLDPIHQCRIIGRIQHKLLRLADSAFAEAMERRLHEPKGEDGPTFENDQRSRLGVAQHSVPEGDKAEPDEEPTGPALGAKQIIDKHRNALESFIFDLSEKGLGPEQVCKQLDLEGHKTPRNRRCNWRHLSWPDAYGNDWFRKSVRKYISTALRRERERRQTD